MHLTAQLAPLNLYQRLARKTIEQAKVSFLIPLLWHFYGAEKPQLPLEQLRQLPCGTLGRGIADILRQHDLQLIPHYEDHDLKHVLLGYGMTAEDELKLRAFMLGNGDSSLTCLVFLALAVLTPELWPTLRLHYRRGRRTQNICCWRMADYAAHHVEDLRYAIGFYEAQEV